MKGTQPGPKRRRLQNQRDLDVEVANGSVTKQVLERRLLEHVESVDANMVWDVLSTFLPLMTHFGTVLPM